MSSLNDLQKQLLFDYCIGSTSEKETAEAEALIASNLEAVEIHSKLKAALAPLDSLELEPCPDDLVERTILRLNNTARSSQLQLQQLLAAEQNRQVTAKIGFWRNLGEVGAVAAVIMLVAGVLMPTLTNARQKYWKQGCRAQLGSIFKGISLYSSDYEGRLPTVAMAAGSPWWKVSHPGKEPCSNTRHLWLPVKLSYIDPADFVCPGRSQGRALQFDISQVQDYHDFPARRYITFSFRVRCPKSKEGYLLDGRALMSDLTPLFENLPRDISGRLRLRLNDTLLSINSRNHKRRGQNVLYGDGSVKFLTNRLIGSDDIFTLQDMFRGCEVQGTEVPTCETDNFFAP